MLGVMKYRAGTSCSPLLVSMFCLVSIGCGSDDYWHAETEPAEGRLVINGESPQGAIVTLHPTGPEVDIRKSKPWGVVDQEGVYRLRTYNKDDGAPRGEYAVTFVWRENPSLPGSPDMLAGAYADPARSKWKVSVEEGQSELPPIEVAGAKVRKPSPARPAAAPSPFDDPVIGG